MRLHWLPLYLDFYLSSLYMRTGPLCCCKLPYNSGGQIVMKMAFVWKMNYSQKAYPHLQSDKKKKSLQLPRALPESQIYLKVFLRSLRTGTMTEAMAVWTLMDLIIQECPHSTCSRARDLWLRSQGHSENSFCVLFSTQHMEWQWTFSVFFMPKGINQNHQNFLMVVVISRIISISWS